jgi:uncharacterized protein (DUF1697 family)
MSSHTGSGPARYAAFLRGINVGRGNRVAMAELRALAERLGYTEVRSHINSGNLVLTAAASERELTEALQQGITDAFGIRVDVAVRTADRLREVLAGNPFPDGDPSRVTVAFLTRTAPAGVEDRLAALAGPAEPFVVSGLEIWVQYDEGQASSRLAAQWHKAVGVSSTVRNVRTVGKVVDLLGS